MTRTALSPDRPRVEDPYLSVDERLRGFDELHSRLPRDMRLRQAERCMACGVPFCQSDYGCPLHNLIPEWNVLLAAGHEREALERLLMTAPFPEFTGRVCPGLCEKACELADEGVTDRDNELYLIETGFKNGWITPRIPGERTGKRVAVCGSGPAGLAAADMLNRMGHTVTVIERADRPGGLLMYGIPNMKLPKGIIERRVRLMEAEGVTFLTDTRADPGTAAGYDAAVLCFGARKARSLNVPGMDAEGVVYAVDYLTAATKALLDGTDPKITARGRSVVVVGGGDTGNDCVGTALRQGCARVTQLEMMPAAPETRLPGNPWPEWPRVMRTDYGQEEAAFVQGADPREYETTVKEAHADDRGRLTAVTAVSVKRSESGGFENVPGTERELKCDIMLIAAGFTGCEDASAVSFGLAPDRRGRLMPADGSHYLGGNLFTAGDARTGQSLVVRALADGRAAAAEADRYLRGK